MNKVVVRQEGQQVFVNFCDKAFIVIQPELAREIAAALVEKAKQAEELRDAERIIHESAMLLRAGAPFTLTSRPDMLEEVRKEALTNRNLRRWLPSIKSAEVVGTPSLVQHPPITVQ